MQISAISLTNFKNYAFSKLQLNEGINVFTGENGAGKTNLLDAVHYLCIGKSYFNTGEQQAVAHEKGFFRLEGSFNHQDDITGVSVAFETGGKKIIAKNKVTYTRIADHVGQFPVVVIAPDDILLINEGSEERRRWLDNTISQVNHMYLEELLTYNKILTQRNALLKQFAVRSYYDEALLRVLDEQLAVPAKNIYAERKSIIGEIIPLIQRFYEIISGNKEAVFITYESVLNRLTLTQALTQSREKDRVLQRTTEGMHKDDLDLKMDEVSLRKFGSQGQKKSFLVALKLAQYEFIRMKKDVKPILLLDDVFDKLDERRVQQMLQLVTGEAFGQVFITDTGETRMEKLLEVTDKPFQLYSVKAGQQPVPLHSNGLTPGPSPKERGVLRSQFE